MSTTFIPRNESFCCEQCGKEVAKADSGYRDHCPFCLYGLHVDVNPGDRANECKGKLGPINIERDQKREYMILYQCETCNTQVRNRTQPDDDITTFLDKLENRP